MVKQTASREGYSTKHLTFTSFMKGGAVHEPLNIVRNVCEDQVSDLYPVNYREILMDKLTPFVGWDHSGKIPEWETG